MKKINWKENAGEKDFVIAIVITVSIFLIFFLYLNFKPEFQPKAEIIKITSSDFSLLEIPNLENAKTSFKSLDYNSNEAKELVRKYNLQRIPVLIIISEDLDKFSLGPEFDIKDDYAVLNSVPYVDIKTGETHGIVSVKEITSDCKDCRSLSQMKGQLQEIGIITDYKVISEAEAEETIKDYNLSFLPALLISKDIEEYPIFQQVRSSLTEKKDYYLMNAIAPYKDLKSGEIKGEVNAIYLTNKSCSDCFNVSGLGSSFTNLGVFMKNEKTVDVSSSEGKILIKKYNITKIPTIILSKEILDYENLKEILDSVGDFNSADQSFVFRSLDKLNVKYQDI